MNKIAVIGGTGKAGKFILEKLQAENYKIKMLVRKSSNVESIDKKIEKIEGDVQNLHTLEELTSDCCGLISTLGQDFNKKPMFETATKNIISALNRNNIKRYIMVAGIAINAPGDNKNLKIKITSKLMKILFRRTIADKQRAFDILRAGNLAWTVVRVPMIKLEAPSAEIEVNMTDCLGTKISATDLSAFIVSQLNEVEFVKQAPFVANKR